MGRIIKYILAALGGAALAMLILAGGGSLIRGTSFADGLRSFWNWAISLMAGYSCGYSWWYNDTHQKQ